MKKHFSRFIFIVTVSVIGLFLQACAYKLSTQTDTLPGNVKTIQIPLFKNDSNEVGAETFFTNALKIEALKASFVKIKNEESLAEAVLQGRISTVEVIADESVIEAKNAAYLPTENVIATQYRVSADVELILKRKSTNEILWRGSFKQTKSYQAPKITLPVINTANSLYNESAKRQTLDSLSKEMMQAAFDRMVENF